MTRFDLLRRGHDLCRRALEREAEGCPDMAAKLLVAAAVAFSEAQDLRHQAIVCIELAALHRRAGDEQAATQRLHQAFTAAGAAGERALCARAVEALPQENTPQLRAA